MIFKFRKFNYTILYFIFSILLFSCKKKDDVTTEPNPPISEIPAITLVSATPNSIHQLSDSIVFTIHYTDGNGDLGFESADSAAVVVTDNRFPLDFYFHLQPLSPVNSTIAITGELPIVLNHIILENSSSAQETVTYSIKLKDRSGNWSNTVTTGNITVLQ